MNPETRLFIDGELVDAEGGATYPNINPATEEAMGEVADAASEDMGRAIAAARRAFDETDWPSNHSLRLKCLQQLKDALLVEMDDCREQIASETGAPLGICGSGGPRCDVPIGFIDYTLEALPNFEVILKAAPDTPWSATLLSCLAVCFHAGQGCAIHTRLLIPTSRQAEVEALLTNYFGYIEYGDPSSASQIMGPLVNARQRQRVLDYIERGAAEGARLLLGGGIPQHLDKGYYVEPTVFVDVSNDMTIAREEIFGPVLVVIAYEDEEDAIRIANDSDYGLSGAVWSADEDRALRVARRPRTGTIMVNGGNYYAADAPFGGYKQSGVGRETGPEGFAEYLETKTIAIGL